MRRGLALVLAAAVLLAGCVAETVQRRRPRRGPVKEVGYVDFGGGQVRYSAEGWGWAVASRRKLALKLMSRNCGRDLEPRVTDEYTRQDADAAFNGQGIDASMDIGDNQHYLIEHYVHLTYECVPRGAPPEPAPSTTTVHAPALVIPPISASSSTLAVAPASPSTSTLASPEPPK
jgi:hypothetical protein